MAESSLRAARSLRKGGLPNALFVAAAAESPPPELANAAVEMTISFPWGSLLGGSLALDGAAASAGIARLLAPGGSIRALVSIDPRDRLMIPALDEAAGESIEARWRTFGLELVGWRRATTEDLARARSSWGRRLASGHDRVVWRLDLVRPEAPADPARQDAPIRSSRARSVAT